MHKCLALRVQGRCYRCGFETEPESIGSVGVGVDGPSNWPCTCT